MTSTLPDPNAALNSLRSKAIRTIVGAPNPDRCEHSFADHDECGICDMRLDTFLMLVDRPRTFSDAVSVLREAHEGLTVFTDPEQVRQFIGDYLEEIDK